MGALPPPGPAKRKMPRQNRGRSEQTVGTPWEFIQAVEARFGKLAIDLASDAANAKAPAFITREDDSLIQPWERLIKDGHGWLNPEYANIAPWARKCKETGLHLRGTDRRIFMLVPASVGSHWFWDHVWGHCLVHVLYPRIKFVGHKDPYPKDLILCEYGYHLRPGSPMVRWIWKGERRK